MRLLVLSLLAGVAVLCYVSACGAMWHCGDIDLSAGPRTVILDPGTGDFFVALETAQVVWIDEATYEVRGQFDLTEEAFSLGLHPSAGLLFAVHTTAGMVTIIDVGTADTNLVKVGELPTGIAIDPLRNTAYVINSGDSTISVIQGAGVSDTVECDGSPAAVAVDPLTGKAFATLKDADLLFTFDPLTGDTSYFATGLEPAQVEIDPEKGELYIANSAENAITVFAIDSDSVFMVPTAGAPTALALNTETRHLFVGTASGSLIIVDTDTYTSQTVDLPAAPEFISIDGLSDRAFASLPDADLLVEVDAAGDTLMVAVSGAPAALVVNPITYKCYVCNSDLQALGVFETADYSAQRITTPGGPGAVVINLEDHKVYSPKYFTGGVVVIDGYTNEVSSIPTAAGPNGLKIDPVSDDIYIVCALSGLVTVKRSDSPDTVLAPIGDYAHGMGINPNTGKLYVSNRYSRDLSVIDMETLDTTLVRTGAYPCYVDLSIDYNKVYVCNRTSWSLTVLDGALMSTTFARIGRAATVCRLNPITNKIYTADSGGRTTTVIDGFTLDRMEIPVGTTPRGLDINPNTNTIYVSSILDGEVTVIDGDTNRRTPVTCEFGVFNVKVDPWLDRAFVSSWDFNSVHLIDGNFYSSLRIPVGYEPHGVAYDPVLEKLYVANHAGNSIDVMKLRDKISPRLEVTIDPLPGDVAYTSTPTITGTATSSRTPRNYGIMKVLYKIDNLRGRWSEATLIGGGPNITWQVTTPPQLLGRHLVFVTALDSTAASLSSSSASALVRMSDIACYEFTCLTPPPAMPEAVCLEADASSGHRLAWTHTSGAGGWYDVEISADPDFSGGAARIREVKSPSYTLTAAEIRDGLCYWRVAAVDYPHGKRSEFSPVYAIGLADGPDDDPAPPFSPLALTIYPNPSKEKVSLRLMGAGTTERDCAIFDVAGRLVTRIPLAVSGANLIATWSATDAWGRPLPQGVYYARIIDGEKAFEEKIILIR